MPSFAQQARATRRRLAADRHRPRVHFLPPQNWMNDPNGLIQFRGEYHMFYQHNPRAAWWGNMTWGHAVSRDLLHWTDLPHALEPDAACDDYGVWSGCAVNDDGRAVLVYTGVHPRYLPGGGPRVQCQCLATTADMVRFTKHPANPVIAGPPPELKTANFRDPYVWRQGRTWHMAVGSSDRDRRGAVLLYTSRDLVGWRYRGPLFQGRGDEAGRIFECPNFFQLGRKWVLIGSPIPLGRAVYFTGTFDGRRFTPEVRGEVDPGGSLYAPQAFLDASGRRVLFGWLWERRSRRAASRAGWAGVMSLPRVLTLRPDGRLDFAPAAEVEQLRRRAARMGPLEIPAGEALLLRGMSGDCMEIAAELAGGRAKRFGLKVRCSRRGTEQTLIVCDRGAGTLAIDTTRSSRSPAVQTGVGAARLRLGRGETLKLRVFLDASVVEVFANGHTCLTGRVYPAGKNSTGAAVFADGGAATAVSLEVWDLKL